MNAILGLLLIAQLNSFEFTAIRGPRTAGESFQVTIVARDPAGELFPFDGTALLSTSSDESWPWSYVYPNVISFRNGVWQDSLFVTLADSLSLQCLEPRGISGESNVFQVLPGSPSRLSLILPGERAAPGSPEGKLPLLPNEQSAGREFTFAVHLTDDWYNITARDDSISFGSTDRFAFIPDGRLTNGTGVFTATMRTAGSSRISGSPVADNSPISTDTSSALTVTPGSYSSLLVLLPGEVGLPGDTTTTVWQTPGKFGNPETQFLGVPFPATVLAVDDCWNPVAIHPDSVIIESNSRFTVSPDTAVLSDSIRFDLTFLIPGVNHSLWASSSSGKASYYNWLDVRSRVSRLRIAAPDTVRAGQTATIRVTLIDMNNNPVVTAPCRFSVIEGSGEMLDTALLSDTLGRVQARFICSRAHGDELNTIKITTDTVGYTSIFVRMSDPSLLDGKIIAFPNPFGFDQDRTEINYYLPRNMATEVSIYDPFGNEIRRWRFSRGSEGGCSGLNRIYWNGRNSEERRVANGIYILQVIGEEHTGTAFKSTHRIGVVW